MLANQTCTDSQRHQLYAFTKRNLLIEKSFSLQALQHVRSFFKDSELLIRSGFFGCLDSSKSVTGLLLQPMSHRADYNDISE